MAIQTYLYIKRHAITGKCYFGKTIQDPTSYIGSGVVWRRHLNKHGTEHIETLWYKGFTDQTECTRIALLFSEQQDIVNSDLWLNLIPENGLCGQSVGYKHSAQAKLKISEANRNRSQEVIDRTAKSHIGLKRSIITKKKMSLAQKGKIVSNEAKEKISKSVSLSKMGKQQAIVECPHCKTIGGLNTMKQWHFDRCKYKIGVK